MKNKIITLSIIALLSINCGQAKQKQEATSSQSVASEKRTDANFAGAGTSDNPFKISTTEQFVKFAELVNADLTGYKNKCFKLTADIDISAYGQGWNNGKGWIPIGTTMNPFEGNFDGGNHTISGLNINDGKSEYIGLFGNIKGGTVQNLVVNGNVTGKRFVGNVAGRIYGNGNIINCHATGAVSGTDDNIGGLVGEIEGNVSASYYTGTVVGNNTCSNVGGVAGRIEAGSVTNCYATGAVSGIDAIGGVVGSIFKGRIANCYSTGAVNGRRYVGGVIGNVSGSNDGSVVTNCYATGTVSCRDEGVGGVAGQVHGTVTNCYATGAVSGNDKAGGVVGYIRPTGRVVNCVALNPSVNRVSGSLKDFKRVAGTKNDTTNPIFDGTLTGNAALDGMKIMGGTATGSDGASLNGEGITNVQIATDGTIGNRFTAANGWTTANGKLPGFGAAIDLPAHLK